MRRIARLVQILFIFGMVVGVQSQVTISPTALMDEPTCMATQLRATLVDDAGLEVAEVAFMLGMIQSDYGDVIVTGDFCVETKAPVLFSTVVDFSRSIVALSWTDGTTIKYYIIDGFTFDAESIERWNLVNSSKMKIIQNEIPGEKSEPPSKSRGFIFAYFFHLLYS